MQQCSLKQREAHSAAGEEEEAAQKVVPLVQGCSSPCSYTVSLLPALFLSVHCW